MQTDHLILRGTLRIAIPALLALALVGRNGLGGERPAKVEPLTVKETIGAVFLHDPRRPGLGRLKKPWHIYAHANPEARAMLQRILDDDNLKLYHAAAIRMLGYIGTGDDATKLLKRFEKLSGVLDGPDRWSVTAFFGCLGAMSCRSVKKADEIAAKLAKKSYWSRAKLKWDARPPSTLGFEYDSLGHFFAGYARCGDEKKLKVLAAPVLETVTDEQAKKYMSWRIDPVRLAKTGREHLAEEKRSPTENERENLRALCKRNFGTLEGEKSELTAADLEFLKKTRAEVLKEYARFKQLVLDGKFDQLRDHLLDNRERISDYQLKTGWNGYKRGLEGHQKKLLEELEKVTCKPANFRIERKAVYREVPSARAGKTREVVKEESLLVTFELEGTSEFGKKHFRNVADWRMFRPDRTLKVLLRKEGGKWYWNPFGW